MSYKTIIKRNESAMNIMKYPKIDTADKQELGKYMQIQTGLNIANKFLMIGTMFLLYRRNFFEKASPYMRREIMTVIGFVGYNYAFEHFNNEFFWSKAQPIVLKYARMKERDFFDLSKAASKLVGSSEEDSLYN